MCVYIYVYRSRREEDLKEFELLCENNSYMSKLEYLFKIDNIFDCCTYPKCFYSEKVIENPVTSTSFSL